MLMIALIGRLAIFFWLAGYPTEALGWVADSLVACAHLGDEADAARAEACEFGAWIATFVGQTDQAATYAESCAALRRKLRDDRGLARALRELAKVSADRGDKATARSQLEQAVDLSRVAGDGWNLSIALNNLGDIALSESKYEDALRFCGEALELRHARGDSWGAAITEINLGFAAMGLEQYDEARRAFAASLELSSQVGPTMVVAESLAMLAAVEVDRDPERAAYLIGASDAAFDETDEVLQAWEAALVERTIANAKAQLTAVGFQAAVARGREAPRDEVVRYAVAAVPDPD
jgi:tetratricopeptide (TPR) repeat protein